ncbi:sensor histidine kinase PhyK [Caulobacter sp. NIBR2454]|uniref:sensor histidine kinase PhyK n=1 Tax=Caulobacter sp. NIBR2454 TaxID=3015996 RepID=UPI0022B678E2|nr:histidine kinase dimerization/phosphoacceptor domain -containing protein [Caulobacter sp. NIBR2454]
MRLAERLGWGPATTIRVRLAAAVAVALLPVLILSAAQTVTAFHRDAESQRESLALGAQRSAATVQARIEAAGVLLETLGPGSVGLNCAQRLNDIKRRLPGYANLIRFDVRGRVACSAETVPSDAARAARPWFSRIREGQSMTVDARPGVAYAAEPSLLAAVRAERDGKFDGALVAVIALSSLQPETTSRALPGGAEIAMVDREGQYFALTSPAAFPNEPPDLSQAGSKNLLWTARDASNRLRTLSAAPLVANEVYVVLSAPSPGLFSWARLNPISRLLLPIFAFFAALAAVLLAAERSIVRWIYYLERVAAIYARGRFTVRPVRADKAPPEIRELAETLDHMAGAIVTRDASLHDSLDQKDALLREIHHRVKNNLQVISSLLSLQQRALTDPASRQAIMDTRQRISALALVYRALYQGPDLKQVDLRPFLEELTAQLLSGDAGPHGAVRTEVHADPLMIDPDRLAPLALFAVEAVANAQKQVFSERPGSLSVEFRVRDGEGTLDIVDDGGGIGVPGAPPSGMGMTLMNAFARQLRGRVSFEPNPAGGLRISLVFPTPEAKMKPASKAAEQS